MITLPNFLYNYGSTLCPSRNCLSSAGWDCLLSREAPSEGPVPGRRSPPGFRMTPSFPPLSPRFRAMCQKVIAHKMFDHVVLVFIFLNCITIALERPDIDPHSTVSNRPPVPYQLCPRLAQRRSLQDAGHRVAGFVWLSDSPPPFALCFFRRGYSSASPIISSLRSSWLR